LLGAPDDVASGLEIAVGDIKQALSLDDEFTGVLQLLLE
jgi:hypothetical protein